MDQCIDHDKADAGKGYGRKHRKGKAYFIHRLVYADHHGVEIASLNGLVVRHTCDNSRCINPEHLLLGTHADNMRDKAIRRRHADIKLTVEQVAYIREHCTPNKVGRSNGNPNSYRALALKFGVNSNAIRQAHLGLSFKHLPHKKTVLQF